MIYWNDLLGPFKSVLPDMYHAQSVRDFLREKQNISIPSFLRMFNPYILLGIGERAIITFTNVDLDVHQHHRNYTISDITGRINVGAPLQTYPKPPPSENLENLASGRYYEVAICYSPRNDDSNLFSAQRFGPPEAEGAQQPDLVGLVSKPICINS